jgi:hypothetical protein
MYWDKYILVRGRRKRDIMEAARGEQPRPLAFYGLAVSRRRLWAIFVPTPLVGAHEALIISARGAV